MSQLSEQLLAYRAESGIVLIVDFAIKATVLLLLAIAANIILRKSSAAVRHRMWSLAFCGLLILPVLTTLLPSWRLPILPAVAQSLADDPAQLRTEQTDGLESSSSQPGTLLGNAQSTAAVVELSVSTAEPSPVPTTNGFVEFRPDSETETVEFERQMPIHATHPQISPVSTGDASAMTSAFRSTTALVCAVWCVGFLIAGWPLVRGFVKNAVLRNAASVVEDVSHSAQVQELSSSLGLSRQVHLLETRRSIVPITWGILRPIVLFPVAWREWSTERRELVLLHELAHVKRLDVAWQLVARIVCAVYWFHPLSWYALRRLRVERELACDDCVLMTGARPSEYARELLEMARSYQFLVLPTTVAMAQTTNLEQRVLSLLDRARSHVPVERLAGRVLLAVAVLAVTCIAIVRPSAKASVVPPEAIVAEQASESVEGSTTTDVARAADTTVQRVTVQGRVLTPMGKPATQAKVFVGLPVSNNNQSEIRFSKPIPAVVKKDGSFSVSYSNTDLVENPEALPAEFFNQVAANVLIAAIADGFGPAWIQGNELRTSESITLTLVEDRPVTGRLISSEGQPVSGVQVKIEHVQAAPNENIQAWIEDLKDGQTIARVTRSRKLRRFALNVTGQKFAAVTDHAGEFRFTGIGKDRVLLLSATGPAMARQMFRMVNRETKPLPTNSGSDSRYIAQVYGTNGNGIVVTPSQPVIGVVRDAETGAALPGVTIESYRLAGSNVMGSRDNLLTAKTNGSGEFQLTGLPRGKGNRLLAVPGDEQPYFMREIRVPAVDGLAPVRVEVELHRGIWIEGKVVDSKTGRPASASLYYLPFLDNKFASELPEFTTLGGGYIDGILGYQHRYRTQRDGTFRIVGLPGRAIVGAETDGGWLRKSYRTGAGAEDIKGIQPNGRFRTYIGPLAASLTWPNVMAEVNPEPDTSSVSVTLRADPGTPQRIRVTDAQGRNVTGYRVSGEAASSEWGDPIANAEFVVSGLGENQARTILIQHEELGLGKVVRIPKNADRGETVVVQLKPGCTVTGSLLDSLGQPIPNVDLRALTEPSEDFNPYLRNSVSTDKLGRFKFENVPPGADYRVRGRSRAMQRFQMEDFRFTARAGSDVDLGAMTVSENGKIAKNKSSVAVRNKTSATFPAKLKNGATSKSASLEFGGRVLGPNGKPQRGIRVSVNRGQAKVLDAITNAEGEFTFRGPAIDKLMQEDPKHTVRIHTSKEGLGIDWQLKTIAELPGCRINFQLQRPVPIEGRIVSSEGKPLDGVRVSISSISHPVGGLDEYIRRAGESNLNGPTFDEWYLQPWPKTFTDDNGRFRFNDLTAERLVSLQIHGEEVGDRQIQVMTRPTPKTNKTGTLGMQPDNRNWLHYFAKFTHVEPANRLLHGIVVAKGTDNPLQGIRVYSPEVRKTATTGPDGRFSFDQCQKRPAYRFSVESPAQPFFGLSTEIEDTPGLDPLDIRFELEQGITARGRVTDGEKPLFGVVSYNILYPSQFAARMPRNAPYDGGYSQAIVQADGTFEIQVLPGPGILTLRASNRPLVESNGRFGREESPPEFLAPLVDWARIQKLIENGPRLNGVMSSDEIAVHYSRELAGSVDPAYVQALTLISPEPADKSVDITLTATRGASVRGTVVDADGKAVNGVTISGLSPGNNRFEPISGDQFTLLGTGPGRRRRVVFYQPQVQQGAVVELSGAEDPDETLRIQLKQCGSVFGKLVDKQNKPIANALVSACPNSGGYALKYTDRSDADGRFKIEGLVPGESYFGQIIGGQLGKIIYNVTSKSGESTDVGQLVVEK